MTIYHFFVLDEIKCTVIWTVILLRKSGLMLPFPKMTEMVIVSQIK